MILLKLKQFFKNQQEASVREAAQALHIQVSAAQGMVDFLVKKRCLQACQAGCSKGNCGGCPVRQEKYRWIESSP